MQVVLRTMSSCEHIQVVLFDLNCKYCAQVTAWRKTLQLRIETDLVNFRPQKALSIARNTKIDIYIAQLLNVHSDRHNLYTLGLFVFEPGVCDFSSRWILN